MFTHQEYVDACTQRDELKKSNLPYDVCKYLQLVQMIYEYEDKWFGDTKYNGEGVREI